MTPLKNLKNWRVVQANTLWWLSLPQNRGRGSFKHLDNIIIFIFKLTHKNTNINKARCINVYRYYCENTKTYKITNLM